MTDQGRKYLSDILRAIELVETFTSDINDFEQYVKDLLTQSAVERQLGIIGEAINRFERLFPALPLENAGKIRGFRNRLIYAYDSLDQSIIWAIIKNHLPPLKKELEKKI